MKGYLSDEEIKSAYKRWCSGEEPSSIAESFFVSERTLWRGFKKLGFKKSRRKSSENVSVTNGKICDKIKGKKKQKSVQ